MSHPSANLNQPLLQIALVALLDQLMPTCSEIDYRLVGTGAALLHGVKLPAADIDILVKTRANVDKFAAALSASTCLEIPSWLEWTQQYYGNWKISGVEIGISTVEIHSESDLIETFGRGPWEHFSLLPCGKYQIPTVNLELRLITELYRQRPDRYQPLVEFMRTHNCDLGLIRRGIEFIDLPKPLQEDILGSLYQRSK